MKHNNIVADKKSIGGKSLWKLMYFLYTTDEITGINYILKYI